MDIVIPSMQRATLQHTWAALPKEWRKRTTIVVPLDEVKQYQAANPKARILGTRVSGIGKLRQWILTNTKATRLAMMDDDLAFNLRRSDDLGKFVGCLEKDIDEMLSMLEMQLGPKLPHGGICTREGGNRYMSRAPVFNTRLLRVLAYHVPTWRAAGIRYDRVPLMEDFDTTLQMLRKGHANFLLTAWCQGQPGSNTAGGCSTYRTPQMQEESAYALQKLHPDFVRIVKKHTKSSWNGQERTDVVISWKKAYNADL